MKRFSSEKELEIVRKYREGMTQKQIADEYGTFNTSIRRVLLRNNIIPKGNNKQQRLCKHNPFKRNNEYSDYFFGLLMTDGNIEKKRHRISLSLNERDGYIIEEFVKWASPKSKITKIHQKLNDSYMWSVTITNEEAYEWLIRRGNFTNKSYEAKLYIPLNYHILRGILDGDGGFVYTNNGNTLRVFICGKSYSFIQQINNFLIKEGYNPKVTYIHELWYVNLYRVNEVLKFGEQLYKNAHIFCMRKYERWLAFYESRKANGVNSGKGMATQP